MKLVLHVYASIDDLQKKWDIVCIIEMSESLRSAGWSWRLELEWCERKILLDWLELELELVAGVV